MENDSFGGIDPPSERPEVKYINVKGREEHEAFLIDPRKCAEHGLDIYYETIVYLKRWGGWLKDEDK
jgi:hypothetical protein